MTQYHVTLNGQGYMLDLGRYRKRIHAPFAPKRSAGLLAVTDLTGPEQVLTISDWSGGEGYTQQDPDHPGRWRQGSGLDGAAPAVSGQVVGGLRLGPRVVSSLATGLAYARPLAVYASKLFVGLPNGQLYSWDGTTATLVANLTGAPTCGEVFLGKLYVGNAADGKLGSWDGTTFTSTVATAGGPIFTLRTHYRQAAQYLYVGAQGAGSGGAGRIYYWDGASLSLGQFDTEESTPIASFVLSGHCYVVTQDATNNRWGIYSVDNTGSGGSWKCHARVTGGYAQAVAVLGATAYVTDGIGGRVWAFDGDSTVTLVKELSSGGSSYGGVLRGIVAWRGAIWVGIRDGSGVGVLRYDGLGWSRPITGITGTDPETMAMYNDQLWVGAIASPTSGAVWRVSLSAFAGSGTLESGLCAFGLSGVSKLLKSVTLVCSAIVSPQTIKVEYQLEDTGGWTTLGTLSSVGATTATYTFAANTTCRQMALRLTLTGTAGASSSPTVYQLAVRYVPRPAVTREWDLAVVLEGTAELPLVTLDGASEPLTGVALTTTLWTAAGASGPVSLVDLDGSAYSVYVQDVREEVAQLSQRRGYQRLGLVTLVEAA